MKLNRNHTEFVLLFTAGLILFAHGIVPHHHHNQQVCIERLVGQNHNINPEHPFESDQPHDDQNHTYCILNQLIVIPNNQWKQDCTCSFSSIKHNHDFVFVITGCTPAAICLFDAHSIPAPKNSHYSLILSRSSRLRAPPAV